MVASSSHQKAGDERAIKLHFCKGIQTAYRGVDERRVDFTQPPVK